MKKTLLSMSLVLALGCTLLTGCGSGKTPGNTPANSTSSSAASTEAIVLSCATKVSEDSFEGKTYQNFADKVAEYTNGEVKVQIYPSEQLGDSTTVINNMQLGTIDMYIEGATFYGGYGVDVTFTSTPFLISDWDNYVELVQGDFGKLQAEQMEDAGFKLLSTERNWKRGPYYVTCSTVPLNDISDMQKIMFRSADSADFMNAFSTLGVSTTVVNYSECYQALQSGTVQAVNCPVSNVESMAFYEVAPYVTYMNCYPIELWPVMNLDNFNKLTADQQDALIRAANEAAAESNAELDDFTNEMIARLEDKGVQFNMDFDNQVLSDMLHDYFAGLAAEGKFPEAVVEFLGI